MTDNRNGEGVCSWREWHESMSEEQRQYEIHRCLTMLHSRVKRIEEYSEKNADWNNKTIGRNSLIGGIIGGIVAVLSVVGIKITLGI